MQADGLLVGAAIAGRPVSRMLDNGQTIEVTRLVSDGTPNACSCLLGAMRRVARAMGYARIITYTLASESGTSLRAAGWTARPWRRGYAAGIRRRGPACVTVTRTRPSCAGSAGCGPRQ